MLTKKSPKISYKFNCEICNYTCNKQSEYNKHNATAKHLRLTNLTKKSPEISTAFICCVCDKEYKSRVGLWQHKQKCCQKQEFIDNPQGTIKEMSDKTLDVQVLTHTIMELVKQNNEFKQLLVEQNKQMLEMSGNMGNNNNNTTNNNNQKFNLNFFLNNTCKDAMNMSDFIENMDINFEDIENIGKNGYVTGMTDMILSRIKNLDVIKRPMHCTDLKRETMYIKDNNEWEKDTPDNKRLRKMMSIISKRNYSTIPLWRDEHPECQNMQHPHCDFSVNMLRNVLGDVGKGQIKLDNKVIKNLSKHIIVEKPL